jgi:nicotinamidase-related amidase
MLEIKNSCLVIVDVQGKLAQSMHDKETLFKNIRILIQAAKELSIPILWCQQVPDALGQTVPEIAELLSDIQPINKSAFSCCGDEKFNAALQKLGRQQILLCGIETHVCIYQTAMDLKQKGNEVHVIAGAVSSRTRDNKKLALKKLKAKSIDIDSVEMVLFELLKTAQHPSFKSVARLIK